MASPPAVSCAGKGMAVSLYRKANAAGGIGREHAPFIVLHALAIYLCLSTVGEPRVAAEEARLELEWKLRTELGEGEESVWIISVELSDGSPRGHRPQSISIGRQISDRLRLKF